MCCIEITVRNQTVRLHRPVGCRTIFSVILVGVQLACVCGQNGIRFQIIAVKLKFGIIYELLGLLTEDFILPNLTKVAVMELTVQSHFPFICGYLFVTDKNLNCFSNKGITPHLISIYFLVKSIKIAENLQKVFDITFGVFLNKERIWLCWTSSIWRKLFQINGVFDREKLTDMKKVTAGFTK